jgi:ribosomal protein S18 acetylase RimI-like enzyme
MYVEQATAPSPELVRALDRLVPQLTRTSASPGAAYLAELLVDTSSSLLVVRNPDATGSIVAAGCLCVYRALTGVRAIVEDVVVDEAWRGRGIGEHLVRRLLDLARQKGARGVSLTSNADRAAANRLYLRVGFSPRQTNSYYYEFPGE